MCVLYTIPGCTWDGLCHLGFWTKGIIHHPRMYLGWPVLPGILKILGERECLCTIYHPGMYLGWLVLPGILDKGYYTPSQDVLGMACVTWDFQDTWTEGMPVYYIERVFSIIQSSFGKQKEQSLEDYIQLSVMMHYNYQN